MAWNEQKTRLQIFRIIRESLFAQEMCGEQDRGYEDRGSEDCARGKCGSEDCSLEECDWNAVYAEMKDHAIAFLAQKWLENGAKKSGMNEAQSDGHLFAWLPGRQLLPMGAQRYRFSGEAGGL